MNQPVLQQFHVTVTLQGEKREFDTRAHNKQHCIDEVTKAFKQYKPTAIEARPLRYKG
jgi:hypothetical protein